MTEAVHLKTQKARNMKERLGTCSSGRKSKSKQGSNWDDKIPNDKTCPGKQSSQTKMRGGTWTRKKKPKWEGKVPDLTKISNEVRGAKGKKGLLAGLLGIVTRLTCPLFIMS